MTLDQENNVINNYHEGDGLKATEQLAKELQKAQDATGLPVGRFLITNRIILAEDYEPVEEQYLNDPNQAIEKETA